MADWSNSGEGIWSGELLVSIVESLVLKEGLVVRVSFFFFAFTIIILEKCRAIFFESIVARRWKYFYPRVYSSFEGNKSGGEEIFGSKLYANLQLRR